MNLEEDFSVKLLHEINMVQFTSVLYLRSMYRIEELTPLIIYSVVEVCYIFILISVSYLFVTKYITRN